MCTYSIRRGAGRPRKMSKHNIDQFASPKRDLTSRKHIVFGSTRRLLANFVRIPKLMCDADCYPTFRALAIYPNAL